LEFSSLWEGFIFISEKNPTNEPSLLPTQLSIPFTAGGAQKNQNTDLVQHGRQALSQKLDLNVPKKKKKRKKENGTGL
jgi:hypothetical protein